MIIIFFCDIQSVFYPYYIGFLGISEPLANIFSSFMGKCLSHFIAPSSVPSLFCLPMRLGKYFSNGPE